MKTCFRCGNSLPLGDFYRHPEMADGHLGKCKRCAIADVIARQGITRPEKAEYERKRFHDPDRRAKVKEYRKRSGERNPHKWAARRRVAYAIRTGKLTRLPCEICAEPKTQAHHEDYNKPLEVRWLCFRCHRIHGHGQRINEAPHEHP